MLLSELEPGMTFKLSDATVKAEQERAKATGWPPPQNVKQLDAGPYQILAPQHKVHPAGSKESVVAAQIARVGGSNWFHPEPERKYEVEVVEAKENERFLPSRGWLMTSADPELFLEQGGKILPGFAVLPTKKKPHFVHGGAFHEDGFQAEFSPAVHQCHERMIGSMRQMLTALYNYVNKIEYDEDMDTYSTPLDPPIRFSDATFVELDRELLANGTDEQVALGCDPSENVYGHPWFTHDNPREFPYRMAGGHIHLGTPSSAKWFHARAERIIKAMDVFCGVPSVALLAGMEDPRRRLYYGRAGEFRYQKHGLEYRVLSNAWLQNPSLAHLVLNMARGAFRIGTSDWEKTFKFDMEHVRHIINYHDVPAAKAFVKENAKVLIWMLNQDGGYGWGPKAITTIFNGAQKTFGAKYLGIGKQWLESSSRTQFVYFAADHGIREWEGAPKEEKKAPVTAPPQPAVAQAPRRDSPYRAWADSLRADLNPQRTVLNTATAAAALTGRRSSGNSPVSATVDPLDEL